MRFFSHRRNLNALLLLAATLALVANAPRVRADEMLLGEHELVIAGHPLASKMGLEVLHRGGNAIDALVTVSLALNVTEPGNSGLGGKLVLLYYDATSKKVTSIVAMDAAPLALTPARWNGLPADKQKLGWMTVCTPGLAAGLGAAHHRWGTLPWAQLVSPDADLAEKGFVLSGNAGAMLSEFHPDIDKTAASLYAPGGHPLTNGDTLRDPDLAHTLRILAADGPAAFYHGALAEQLVAGARAAGGVLSLEDLAQYQPRVLEPLVGPFQRYTVYSSPPPLTGGTTLLAALDCLAPQSWAGVHPRDAKYIDSISRVMEQVYPAVNRAAADVPDSLQRVDRLLAPANIARLTQRAHDSDPRHPLTGKNSEAANTRLPPALAWAGSGTETCIETCNETYTETYNDDSEHGSTTHLIIIDRKGDIVCCTQSLGLHFGADVMAPGTGYLLNADVGNFSTKTPSSLNYLGPGKWPRSTMAPTIFFKDDKPVLAIGSPAAQRIPTAVLQVSLDVLDFDQPLADAIRAPRFHIQTPTLKDGPNNVDLESTSSTALDPALTAMGWNVHRRSVHDFYFGCVNAAQIAPDGTITAVADQRRTSDVAGD
jgi:gamma-glutamyltranspeptidase/glutathione hydrolase